MNKNTTLFRVLATLVGMVFLLGCQGCRKDPINFNTNDGSNYPITKADIAYNDLAQRYNKQVEPFDRLWTRTDVEIEWFEVDEDGERDYRYHTGDGKFMMRRPNDTMLTIEKAGKVFIWAGSNDQQYWMFDLVKRGNKTAYVGRFDKLDAPGRKPFPLPVRSDLVPVLLGLVPMPVYESPALGKAPPVEMYNGQYLVELPVQGVRMLIDPKTYRPTRVDLLNRAGYSVLISKLSGQYRVEVDGVPEAQRPLLCKKAAVYVSGYESRLTVEIDDAEFDEDRFRDQAFRFESIRKAYKPQTVRSLDP